MAVRDDWIIYAIFGVFVCLLLWRVATQWKVKSTEAENLRVSVVIFGVVALVLVVWQCVRQASPIAAHSQDKTITVFAAASNESTRFNLLGNVLVLIAGKDSKIDHVDIEPGFDLAKLANDGRIATGDVQEVPVGLYAKASLEKLGVWPSVESKMAIGKAHILNQWERRLRALTSAFGTKRTFPRAPSMSVFGGKADIGAIN